MSDTIINTMKQLSSSNIPTQYTATKQLSDTTNTTTQNSDTLRQQWVTTAIQSVTNHTNDAKNYTMLCNQIQSAYTEHNKVVQTCLQHNITQYTPQHTQYSLQLYRWYSAIAQCTSQLQHKTKYNQLLQLIYSFNYKQQCYCTLQAYTQLLLNLLLSQPHCIYNGLKALVQSFLANNVVIDLTQIENVDSVIDIKFDSTILNNIIDNTVCNIEQIHMIVHTVLQRIVRLIPNSVTILFNILIELYPHKRYNSYTHQLYVKNLLHITSYVTVLRQSILTAICERCIQLDVEVIQADTEIVEQKLVADKLDHIMCCLFQYLQYLATQHHTVCTDIYNILIYIYEHSILKTHKSRFVQYLLFYYCSFSHAYTEQYIQYLLNHCLHNNNTSIIDRISCTSYIASYIARAKYIRHITAINTFDQCIQWLHHYPQHNINSDDTSTHQLYYCIFQCILYIFCYRQQSFIHIYDNNITKIQQKYRFDLLINSPLNPLRYCNIHIVTEFSRITYELCIVNCYTILQYNAQYIKQNDDVTNSDNTLNTTLFFPYDPYQLRLSSAYIEPLYIEYTTHTDNDSDSDSDDESEHKSIDMNTQLLLERRTSVKRKSPSNDMEDTVDTTETVKRISPSHKQTNETVDDTSDVASVSQTMSDMSFNPITGSPVISPYIHSHTVSPAVHSVKITPLLGNVSPAVISKQYISVPVFSPLVSAVSPLVTVNHTNNNVNAIDLKEDDNESSSSSDSDNDSVSSDDSSSSSSSSKDDEPSNADKGVLQPSKSMATSTTQLQNDGTVSDSDESNQYLDDSDDDLPIAVRHANVVTMLKG